VNDCRFDSSLYKTPAFFLDKMTTPAMPRPFPTTHEYTHKPATRVSFYLEYIHNITTHSPGGLISDYLAGKK
jgi:hypothetical protein